METSAFTIGQKFTNNSSNKVVAISQIRDSGKTIVLGLVNSKGEVSDSVRTSVTISSDNLSMWIRRELYTAI